MRINLRLKMIGAEYHLRSVALSAETPSTGIATAVNDAAAPTGIYRIDGVRQEAPTAPDLYIIDGKKAVIR